MGAVGLNLTCDFCGKPQKKVAKMIGGVDVYICNECVETCNEILADCGIPPSKGKPVRGAYSTIQMTLLDFLKLHLAGRPVDSITVDEFLDVVENSGTLDSKVGHTTPDYITGEGDVSVEKLPYLHGDADPTDLIAQEMEEWIQGVQLDSAIEEMGKTGKRLPIILCERGYVGENFMVETISRLFGLPVVDLSVDVSIEAAKLLPREFCEAVHIFAISLQGGDLVVAMVDPSDRNAIRQVEFLTGYSAQVVLATPSQISKLIARHLT